MNTTLRYARCDWLILYQLLLWCQLDAQAASDPPAVVAHPSAVYYRWRGPPQRLELDVNEPAADASVTLDTLVEEHRRLDARLRELDAQRSLTTSEQVEYGVLKKQKLLAKDRIARLQAPR